MTTRSAITGSILALFVLTMLSQSKAEAESKEQGTPVRVVVSVETRHKAAIPNITMQDVVVKENNETRPVVEWLSATGDRAGLELFILLDDSSAFSVDTQLTDLRGFIMSQAPSTFVGLAYIRNGSADVAQKLTADHASVAKAVRLPVGNSAGQASPYFAVEDLLKHWDPTPARPRREVVMITSGIDLYSPGAEDPYISDLIQQAQRAEVPIYSIYTPGSGHFGHSYWRSNWGQNNLSQVSDESGGESYNLNPISAVSFKPFLDDISLRFGRQYLLTFLAKPEVKAGMHSVKLSTEVPDADLVSADRVFVPASSHQ